MMWKWDNVSSTRDELTLKELSFEHPDGVINVSAGYHK